MQPARNANIPVAGHVEPQFAAVVDAFVAGFDRHDEVGAALAVYHRGELVVDLAAGRRDRNSDAPYTRDTLQPVFSATKGITALAANMLADSRQLDLDAAVASYWPEFARHGKSEIPVRWLLDPINRACSDLTGRYPSSNCWTGRWSWVVRQGSGQGGVECSM